MRRAFISLLNSSASDYCCVFKETSWRLYSFCLLQSLKYLIKWHFLKSARDWSVGATRGQWMSLFWDTAFSWLPDWQRRQWLKSWSHCSGAVSALGGKDWPVRVHMAIPSGLRVHPSCERAFGLAGVPWWLAFLCAICTYLPIFKYFLQS